jgi:hypothetical protein
MGKKRNVYEILFEIPEGKRSLERYSCRLVDNIKINIKEMGLEGLE